MATQKFKSAEQIAIEHKEHLCSNYKPIMGEIMKENTLPLMNPFTGAKISKCINGTLAHKPRNRCNYCNNFKPKQNDQ